MGRLSRSLLAGLLLLATLSGCSSTDEFEGHEDALSFAGVATQGYEFRTEVSLGLPEEISAMTGAERDAAVRKHADEALTVLNDAIRRTLRPSWLDIKLDRRPPIRVRYPSLRNELTLRDDGTYTMVARAEFVSIKDLLSKLPVANDAKGSYVLVKTKGRAGMLNHVVKTYITPVETSLDVYPKYMNLFDDGLDISVHVGGDWDGYLNLPGDGKLVFSPRVDLDRARSVYDHLLSTGFKSSVRFEELKMDSPPLTKHIQVRDRDISVRVRIFHAEMRGGYDGARTDAFKQSLSAADVVIYDGHSHGSGALYFSSGNNAPAEYVNIKTFKNFEVTEKQQIYFFNGCDTYFEFMDGVYAHPKRNSSNTDIVTSIGTAWLGPKATPVINFIDALLGGASDSTPWKPNTWQEILETIGDSVDGDWEDVYGVGGIDDNSKANPLK